MSKTWFKSLSALIAGHFTVLKHAFRKRITLEYPEVKKKLNERFRGRLAQRVDENGELTCTGCALCQMVCPCKGLIKIEKEKQPDGKLKVTKFEIDMGHCIFCGNCAEICPNSSIYMTKKYELAAIDKQDLVLDIEKLKEKAEN